MPMTRDVRWDASMLTRISISGSERFSSSRRRPDTPELAVLPLPSSLSPTVPLLRLGASAPFSLPTASSPPSPPEASVLFFGSARAKDREGWQKELAKAEAAVAAAPDEESREVCALLAPYVSGRRVLGGRATKRGTHLCRILMLHDLTTHRRRRRVW